MKYGAYLTEISTTDLMKHYNLQKKTVSKSRYQIHALNSGILSITEIRNLKSRIKK